MTNDNETVEDIVREMRSEPLAENGAKPWLHYLADRIEKACKESEKKYEYSVHPADVYGVFQHRSAAELNVNFFKALGVRTHLVRREVGEWEEVKE